MKEGQRVSFKVVAYPNDSVDGKVTQVRQEATTTSNVVTYEVVISAPNPDLKLKPGLTANVTIFTQEQNGILCVPAKALRFTPNPTLLAPDETIEDAEGRHKLWTREGKTFKAHPVVVGVTNGSSSEIKSGIAENTEVILDSNISGGASMPGGDKQSTESSPFAPTPPGAKRK